MRIISLCPSLTELVFDLDRGKDVVACTRYCIRPAEQVAGLPKVGGTKNPKIEQILDLEPDLVLLNEEENRQEDNDSLEAAGIRSLSYFPRTVPETIDMIRDLAHELDASERGDVLITEIEDQCQRAQATEGRRDPLRFVYLIWRKPWMTLNGDTYVSHLLELAGGQNVFGALAERYPPVSAEELAAAAPDQIFLSSEPFPFQQAHLDELVGATGLPPDRFRLVDGQVLSWHGSSTAPGIAYALSLMQDQRNGTEVAAPVSSPL